MPTAHGIRAGRAFVELATENSKLVAGLKDAQKRVREFAEQAGSAAFSGAAALTPIALATKTFADFDDQMRLAQAVSGATGEAFAKLTETAKTLGRTTSWTAAQVASGMVALGRMGFDSSEIDASISSVMNLARATGTEIPVATDIAGNTLRQFGLEASEMARVCNVMTTTANRSAQTLEDLGEAMKYAAPIAKTANLSLEDTALLLGQLANFGIKGSMAGTSVRNMLTQLADKSIQKELQDSLGVVALDAEGNLRNLVDVVEEIGVAAQSLPNADQLAIFDKLFGKRPLAASAALAGADFTALRQAIEASGNSAQETAEKMDEGLGGAIRITLSAVEGLSVAIGAALSPSLQELGESLQDSVGGLTKWIQEHQDAVTATVKTVASVTALTGGLWLASKAIAAVTSVASLATSGLRGLALIAGTLTGATKAASAATAAAQAVEVARQRVEAAKLATLRAVTAAEIAKTKATLQGAQADLAAAEAASTSAKANAAAKSATASMIGGWTAAIAVLAALAFAVDRYAAASQRATEKAREQTTNAKALVDENMRVRDADRELFQQLDELSKKQSLTNEEFATAQNIVAELTKRYGDLGIRCDEATKSIQGMSNAQKAFNDAQRAIEKKDLENLLAKQRRELEALKKEAKDFGFDTAENNWRAIWKDAKSFFGGEDWFEGRARNKQEQSDLNKEIQSTIDKIKALNNLQQAAAKDAQAPPMKVAPDTSEAQKVVDAFDQKFQKETARDKYEAYANAQQELFHAGQIAAPEYVANLARALDWVTRQEATAQRESTEEKNAANWSRRLDKATNDVAVARIALAKENTDENKQALKDALEAQAQTEKDVAQERADDAQARLADAVARLANATDEETEKEARQDMVAAGADLAEFNEQLAGLLDAQEEEKLSSAGTFDAFEALDWQNDWQRSEMRKQTALLQRLVDDNNADDEWL
ncbi:MAG: phage tail tape measure protein [Thermoguttaceae bacterium]|nr:phage tail tape measure protein [Thermoguttaceae bacterium]